jgi:hypothetical protein
MEDLDFTSMSNAAVTNNAPLIGSTSMNNAAVNNNNNNNNKAVNVPHVGSTGEEPSYADLLAFYKRKSVHFDSPHSFVYSLNPFTSHSISHYSFINPSSPGVSDDHSQQESVIQTHLSLFDSRQQERKEDMLSPCSDSRQEDNISKNIIDYSVCDNIKTLDEKMKADDVSSNSTTTPTSTSNLNYLTKDLPQASHNAGSINLKPKSISSTQLKALPDVRVKRYRPKTKLLPDDNIEKLRSLKHNWGQTYVVTPSDWRIILSEDWVSEKHSLHDMIPCLDTPEDWWLSAAQSIKEDESGKSQTSFVRELLSKITEVDLIATQFKNISKDIESLLDSSVIKLSEEELRKASWEELKKLLLERILNDILTTMMGSEIINSICQDNKVLRKPIDISSVELVAKGEGILNPVGARERKGIRFTIRGKNNTVSAIGEKSSSSGNSNSNNSEKGSEKKATTGAKPFANHGAHPHARPLAAAKPFKKKSTSFNKQSGNKPSTSATNTTTQSGLAKRPSETANEQRSAKKTKFSNQGYRKP